MEALFKRTLRDGKRYDHLFPAPELQETTIKKGASVYDTVAFIPKVVGRTRWQLEAFVDAELNGLATESACHKLWEFVKNHIEYRKDKRGQEQVRSPRRLWHDRKGDCDCYTVFISGCLSLLGIPVIHRITKYSGDHFQHIYPIVPLPDGRYIIMDCVVHAYNYEEPYSEKKDFTMDLEYLDGIEGAELGAFNLKDTFKKIGNTISTVAQKVGETVKEGLHVINKVNPATLLLRAGVLAAMKINLMNVAGRLKWAYLSEEEAVRRGADRERYKRLRTVLSKLEEIFHGAGGEAKNLKKAILEGKGNADHSVSGLGQVAIHAPLSVLLGEEVMHSEGFYELQGIEGLGTLGEPATAAAITAATGAIAAIAALLKQIGQLFPGGKAGAADFAAGDNENYQSAAIVDAGSEILPGFSNLIAQGQGLVKAATSVLPSSGGGSPLVNQGSLVTIAPPQQTPPPPPPPAVSPDEYEMVYSPTFPSPGSESAPQVDVQTQTQTAVEDPPGQPGFWENNKKWLKPTLFIGGGLIVTAAGVAIYRASRAGKKGLSGLNNEEEVEEVALM